MASVGVIEHVFVFLARPKFLLICVLRKGVRLRPGRHWVTPRSSHLLILWSLCCVVCIPKGWDIVSAVHFLLAAFVRVRQLSPLW